MATVANLAISLTAKTNAFNKKLLRSKRNVTSFSDTVVRSAKRMLKFGAAMAGVAAGGMVLLTRQSMKTIDTTMKVSQKLGIAVDKLIGLRHAAQLSGVEIRTFDMGLQRFARRVAEAAVGTGEAQAAIKELGLSAQLMATLPLHEQFYMVADAMDGVTNASERVRLGFKLFDSEGVAVINMLRGGSPALRQFQKDAERLGITFTEELGQKVVDANDAMDRMRAAMRAIAQTMAAVASPALERMADKLTNFLVVLQKVDKTTWRAMANTAKWVAGIGAAIFIIPKLIRAMRAIVIALKAINVAQIVTKALMGPKGWAMLAAGIVVAGIALKKAAKLYGEVADGLGRAVEAAGVAIDKATKATSKATGPPATLGTLAQEIAKRQARQQQATAEIEAQGAAVNGLAQAAQRLYDQTRTPGELRKIEEDKLFQLFNRGAIGIDLYLRGMQKVSQGYLELVEDAKRLNEVIDDMPELPSLEQRPGQARQLFGRDIAGYGAMTQAAHVPGLAGGRGKRKQEVEDKQIPKVVDAIKRFERTMADRSVIARAG